MIIEKVIRMAMYRDLKTREVAAIPRAPDGSSFSRHKVDDTQILKVAEYLSGYRQYSAILLIEKALEDGTTKNSRENVLKELIVCTKKGGMFGDCIFVALEALAMDRQFKRPVLKFMDYLIRNGANSEIRENARVSRKHISDLHTPNTIKEMLAKLKAPLAEGHI